MEGCFQLPMLPLGVQRCSEFDWGARRLCATEVCFWWWTTAWRSDLTSTLGTSIVLSFLLPNAHEKSMKDIWKTPLSFEKNTKIVPDRHCNMVIRSALWWLIPVSLLYSSLLPPWCRMVSHRPPFEDTFWGNVQKQWMYCVSCIDLFDSFCIHALIYRDLFLGIDRHGFGYMYCYWMYHFVC